MYSMRCCAVPHIPLPLVIIMELLSYRQYLKLEGSGEGGPSRSRKGFVTVLDFFKYPGGCSFEAHLATPGLKFGG